MGNCKNGGAHVEGADFKTPHALLDVNELVRSIQKREGHPDRFLKNQADCIRKGCFWRHWCL